MSDTQNELELSKKARDAVTDAEEGPYERAYVVDLSVTHSLAYMSCHVMYCSIILHGSKYNVGSIGSDSVNLVFFLMWIVDCQ